MVALERDDKKLYLSILLGSLIDVNRPGDHHLWEVVMPHTLTKDQFEEWLRRYKAAWEARDAQAAEKISSFRLPRMFTQSSSSRVKP